VNDLFVFLLTNLGAFIGFQSRNSVYQSTQRMQEIHYHVPYLLFFLGNVTVTCDCRLIYRL
jgi:hypothetical protein